MFSLPRIIGLLFSNTMVALYAGAMAIYIASASYAALQPLRALHF